jgi:type IV pilus assembly protein PilX
MDSNMIFRLHSQRHGIPKESAGSVLVIALILLLIISIGSLSVLGGVKYDAKMSDNFEQHQLAFQAAEEALSRVEKEFLEDVNYIEGNFLNSCVGLNCFNVDCIDGRCGLVTYLTEGVENCAINPPVIPVWLDDVRRNNAPSITIDIDRTDIDPAAEIVSLSVKYLIEFRCHVPKVANPSPDTFADWASYFRVTVWIEDDQLLNSPIMLQSTYQRG